MRKIFALLSLALLSVTALSAQLASDNFNRANANPLDGSWTNGPGALVDMRIVSNAATAATASTDAAAFSTAATWPNDQYSEVTIGAAGTGDGGPMVRMDANGNGYMANANGGTITLFSISGNGTNFGNLTGTSGSVTGGDVFRIEAEGTTIRIKKNGATVLTHTDATWTAGAPGIFNFDGSMTFDSWAGGDFSAGGGGSIIPKVMHYRRLMERGP